MDLVHLEDTVTGSCVSGQCVENLHNNMEIEESMLRQKHCEPIKNLPAITICDRKCCSFVNRELPFIKICPERGRYRVGPFLMPRPFGIEEESLINFCMDDDLKKGEMLFQTNFYGITRNDIMSLSPRSIINMKVVSAVSELLSAETTVNVGQSKFNLFLPAYNTLQDHVGGEYRNASVAGGKFIPADLYAKSIRPWEKIFVPVNCGHGCWYMLVIVISEMRVEILDPLPTSMCMHYNIAICKRLLRSIEMMLDHGGSNVNSSSLKLMDFSVDYTRQPCICSEYDCALYIMLMMERHNMRSTLNDAEFQSDVERARFVIKLITCSFNFLKDKVRSSAEMHQRRIDVAEHNAGEAIQKRRLHQLRRSRRMGHGPRR